MQGPWSLRFAFLCCLLQLLLLSLATESHAQSKKVKSIAEVKDSLGTVREKGFVSEGKKNGMWSYYDSKGRLSKKVKYRNDAAIWTFLYENGKITESINRKGKVKKRTCNCPN